MKVAGKVIKMKWVPGGVQYTIQAPRAEFALDQIVMVDGGDNPPLPPLKPGSAAIKPVDGGDNPPLPPRK